ncbi:hypothetical protein MMC20_007728 [Loxospora ochrophaea]|nr:hypothetical protein [Loxospora ochrophaea]
MNHFRVLQEQITNYQIVPPLDAYYEAGYEILRQCITEAQSVLTANYNMQQIQASGSPREQVKRQLQRVLLDASARRFQAQKIFLRASAAARWVNARTALVQQGQMQSPTQAAALRQATYNLRTELTGVTNERVFNDLYQVDRQARHWLQDDPSLQTILNWIRSQGSQ